MVCDNIAGIAYKFSNHKILSFQDNFKCMYDLPFTVYFDFETITGNSAIDDKKMFVSYCQVFAFQASLKLLNVVYFEVSNTILKKSLASRSLF